MNGLGTLLGSIGFILAFLSCLSVVWMALRNNVSRLHRWLWLAISLGAIIALIEVQYAFRFAIKPYLVDWVVHFISYGERRGLQVIVVSVFVSVFGFFLIKFIRTKTLNVNSKFAIFGAVMAFFLFGLEIISLHAVDAILYAQLFDLYTVCWLWNVSAIIMIIAAYREVKHIVKHTA